MKQGIYTIQQHQKLAKDVYLMELGGDTSAITAPGQFVNILLEGKYLRRPISICDWNEASLTLIYKVVGQGTAQMREMKPGTQLDLLTGLGNGFTVSKSGQKPLLAGGGVGVPPLFGLAKALIMAGKQPVVALGFASKEDVFAADEFRAIGCPVTVATVDGSFGTKGFVTNLLDQKEIAGYDYYYSCGPIPMLKALYDACPTDGQLSFEERMGCGFGACMGCNCKTKYGSKRICKDGPVLEKEEIIW